MISLTRDLEPLAVYVAAGWWVIAALIGLRLGRRAEATPPIARLLAGAKTQTTLPEHRPGAIIDQSPVAALGVDVRGRRARLPRAAGAGIAAGFAIIWALAWRRQDAAVEAIEERDGAFFYVIRPRPGPMSLERTPGFKALRPTRERRRHLSRAQAADVLLVSLGSTGACAGPTTSCRTRCAARARGWRWRAPCGRASAPR